jgi:hypothetical protein
LRIELGNLVLGKLLGAWQGKFWKLLKGGFVRGKCSEELESWRRGEQLQQLLNLFSVVNISTLI